MKGFMLFGVLSLAVFSLSTVSRADDDSTTNLDGINEQAMSALNGLRDRRGLPQVQADSHLADRCLAWIKRMGGGLRHDPKVYGTPERENLAGAWGYNMTIDEAMRMWEHSPGHAASMFDRNGFPTAYYGGYAQYKGYACLRLCPRNRPNSGPCS